jgi:hypothetical protein
MRRLLSCALATCVGLSLASSISFAQHAKDDKKPTGHDHGAAGHGDQGKAPAGGTQGMPPMTPEQQKEMEAWMGYMTPGPQHKQLSDHFAGTWTAETTFWMEPGGPAMKSGGVMTNQPMMDGRYLHHMFKGEPMMGMPTPFEGAGTMGYDNALKKYVGTWMDNMGTGTMYMTGTYDEAKKQYTLSGEMPDITKDGKMCTMREVMTVHDKDHHTMEMYAPDRTGKEFKCMEIKYTRQK